jgi:hypothetical protein
LDFGTNTIVETIVTYKSLEDLGTVLKMSMQQGLASAMERLDDLFLTITK